MLRDLAGNEGRHAAEAGEIKAGRLVEGPVGHAVGEPTAQIAPPRMPLVLVMPEHHIQPVLTGVLPQPHGLGRGVLAVVIQIHDVQAPRLPPAREHGVVLAVVARMVDENERPARRVHEFAANLRRRIPAAVVHQHDLVSALDRQSLDLLHQRPDRGRAVVQRNDKAERGAGRGHAVAQRMISPVTLSTSAQSRPGCTGRQSTSAQARSVTGSPAVASA